MRRMFSKKQIEQLAKQVADYEIGEAEILWGQNILEVSGLNAVNYLPFFDEDGYSGFINCNDTDAGKVVGVDESGYLTFKKVSELYKHTLVFTEDPDETREIILISNSSDEISDFSLIQSYFYDHCVSGFFRDSNNEDTKAPILFITATGTHITCVGASYGGGGIQTYTETYLIADLVEDQISEF